MLYHQKFRRNWATMHPQLLNLLCYLHADSPVTPGQPLRASSKTKQNWIFIECFLKTQNEKYSHQSTLFKVHAIKCEEQLFIVKTK